MGKETQERQGAVQFSSNAPTTGRDRALPGVHTPDAKPEKTKNGNLKTWIIGGVSGVLAIATGVGGGLVIKNSLSPGSAPENSPIPIIRPIDLSKLDTGGITLEFSKNNLNKATPEQVQDFTHGEPLEMPKNIETPDQLPTFPVMYTVGAEQAGEIKIWREDIQQYWKGELKKVPIYLKMSAQNSGTREGLVLLKNVNTDEAEVFLQYTSTTSGETFFRVFYEKFDLGDGRYAVLEVTTDNSNNLLKATDSLKGVPIISSGRPKSGINYLQDVLQETGLKIKISESPTLFTTV